MRANVKKLFGALTALVMLAAMLPCNAAAAGATEVSAISWSGAPVVKQSETDTEYALKIGDTPSYGRFSIAETENVLISADVYVPSDDALTLETVKVSDVLATAKLADSKVHVSGGIAAEGFGTYTPGTWVNVKLLQNIKSGEYNVYIDDKAVLLLEAQGEAGLPDSVKLTAKSLAYAKNVTVSEYTPVENRVRTIYEKDELVLAPDSSKDETAYFFYAGEDVNTRIENSEHVRISFNAVFKHDSKNEARPFWVGLVEDKMISGNHGSVRTSSDGLMFKVNDSNKAGIKQGGSGSQTMSNLAFTTNDSTAADYVIDICADETSANEAAVTIRVGNEIAVTSFTCASSVTLRDCRNFVFQVDANTPGTFTFKDIKIETISSASAVYFEDFEGTLLGNEPADFTKYSTKTQINETFKVVDGSQMNTYTAEDAYTSVTGNSSHVAEFYQPQYTGNAIKRMKDGGAVEDMDVSILTQGTSETVYITLPEEMKGADNLRLSFNLYNPLNSVNSKTGKGSQKLRIGFHNECGDSMATNRTDSVIFDVVCHEVVNGTDQRQSFTTQATESATLTGFNTLTWGNLALELNRTYESGQATGYSVTALGRGKEATGTAAVTLPMNYVMMQIPYNVGGKYYLDNILIEKVCPADAFVGKTKILAEGVRYAATAVKDNNDSVTGVTVAKTGNLPTDVQPTLYFAVYEGGKLVSCQTAALTNSTSEVTFDNAVTLGTDQSYRIFIFDQNLVPMMSVNN